MHTYVQLYVLIGFVYSLYMLTDLFIEDDDWIIVSLSYLVVTILWPISMISQAQEWLDDESDDDYDY